MPIQAAKLEYASDGTTLFSSQFDDIYHSADGAREQAQRVFLAGNQLPIRWQGKNSFSIIETGFGQGISFLGTWLAWRNDPMRSSRLHFISVEQRPFSQADLAALHLAYPEFAELSQQLLAHWPHLTPGFHRIWLDDGQVSLTLLFGDVLAMLHEVLAQVDAIYLDGFSPSKNPEMWSLPVFKALWRLCKADTTLATYTVAGHVRRGLIEAGFHVEKTAGFGNKRHMLTGRCARLPKPPRIVGARKSQARNDERAAIIIGAGIAGCATAASLAERGWQIQLFDADSAIAQGASGNHVGLCHPTFSKDDNALARLSRIGFALTRQKLAQMAKRNQAIDFGMDGHFQMAKDEENETLLRETTKSLNFPSNLVRYLSRDEARLLLGYHVEHGGWWFEQGTWLNPASLCRGYINQYKDNIDLQLNTYIAHIEYINDRWHLYTADQQLIATTSKLILANAQQATQLIAQAQLPLSESWRAVTQIPSLAIPAQLPSCSGSAYLTAALRGYRSLGAAPLNSDDRAGAQAANLAALQHLLPGVPNPIPEQCNTRVCARPNSLDRLPLVGALHAQLQDPRDRQAVHQLFQMPRQDGLYTVLGFGSRGITWHALAAEIIACHLNNEPLPIERDLLNAIDPARFELRLLRKTQAH